PSLGRPGSPWYAKLPAFRCSRKGSATTARSESAPAAFGLRRLHRGSARAARRSLQSSPEAVQLGEVDHDLLGDATRAEAGQISQIPGLILRRPLKSATPESGQTVGPSHGSRRPPALLDPSGGSFECA